MNAREKYCVAKWSMLTPKWATQLVTSRYYQLQRNIRPVHQQLITRLHQENKLDGRAINIVSGVLPDGRKFTLNGYHTCCAVIALDKALSTLMVDAYCTDENDMADLYSVYDKAMKRQMIDALKAHGYLKDFNASEMQAIGNSVKIINAGFRGTTGQGNIILATDETQLTRDIDDWLPEASQYFKIVDIKGIDKRIKGWLRSGPIVAVCMMLLRQQPEKAVEYITGISTGLGMDLDDPRKRFYDNMLSAQTQRDTATRIRKAALAWNKFYAGDKISYFNVPTRDRSKRLTAVGFFGTTFDVANYEKMEEEARGKLHDAKELSEKITTIIHRSNE